MTISFTIFRLGNSYLTCLRWIRMDAIFNVKWPKLCSTLRRHRRRCDFTRWVKLVHEQEYRAKEKAKKESDRSQYCEMKCDAERERERKSAQSHRLTNIYIYYICWFGIVPKIRMFSEVLYSNYSNIIFLLRMSYYTLNYTKKTPS